MDNFEKNAYIDHYGLQTDTKPDFFTRFKISVESGSTVFLDVDMDRPFCLFSGCTNDNAFWSRRWRGWRNNHWREWCFDNKGRRRSGGSDSTRNGNDDRVIGVGRSRRIRQERIENSGLRSIWRRRDAKRGLLWYIGRVRVLIFIVIFSIHKSVKKRVWKVIFVFLNIFLVRKRREKKLPLFLIWFLNFGLGPKFWEPKKVRQETKNFSKIINNNILPPLSSHILIIITTTRWNLLKNRK